MTPINLLKIPIRLQFGQKKAGLKSKSGSPNLTDGTIEFSLGASIVTSCAQKL